jgi:hypothetical protein
MSATTSNAIADKISAILDLDDTGRGFIGVASRRPQVKHFSAWELDLIDWGAIYGLAFGIARAENPWESVESVAERALAAAWPKFLAWGGDFKYDEREVNEGEEA